MLAGLRAACGLCGRGRREQWPKTRFHVKLRLGLALGCAVGGGVRSALGRRAKLYYLRYLMGMAARIK